jgi:hypothetical protein
MAKRDIELIVALAEGRLDDEREARALIERSERLRSIHEAQTRAIEALTALPPAVLTDAERSVLRRDLWTTLTTEQAGTTEPARTGWGLHRVGYAAGAAVLVVGLVAALGQLTPTSDDTAAIADSDRIQTAGESDGGISPASTDAPPPVNILSGPEMDLFSGYAEQARTGSLEYLDPSHTIEDHETLMSCIERAGLADHTTLGDVVESGRVYTVVVPEGDGVGPETPVAFVDLDTCKIAHLDE